MEATSIRPGYELWRPNRERNDAKATKVLVAIVLLASAALLVIITLGGWERLQGASVGAVTLAWAALYVLFAFLVIRWQRGILPVAAALAVLMLIFAAVSAPGWFARDKDGLSSPALPEELIGLLVVIMIPVQIVLIAVAMYALQPELARRGGAPDRWRGATSQRRIPGPVPSTSLSRFRLPVPEVGFEPTRPFGHGILSAASLPFLHSGVPTER